VGCALDEGLANPKEDTYTVFYGERAVWWLRIKGDVTKTKIQFTPRSNFMGFSHLSPISFLLLQGAVGHGSRFVKNQAVIRVINAVNKFMAYRAEQEVRKPCIKLINVILV
jgi:hypothetical protein